MGKNESATAKIIIGNTTIKLWGKQVTVKAPVEMITMAGNYETEAEAKEEYKKQMAMAKIKEGAELEFEPYKEEPEVTALRERLAQERFFSINGFWKNDSGDKFEGRIVSNKEWDEEEGEKDGRIFFYGLSENDIKRAIEEKWATEYEFVITSYNPQ